MTLEETRWWLNIKVYLPIRIVFVVTSRHGADVGLLGWQISGDPVLEVVPGQVVLQVTVRVLGRSLELAQRTNLDCVLSGVSGNSCNNSRIINTIRIKSSENKQQPGACRSGCSQWEEAKLGSAAEKLENFHFLFHWRLPLILRFT